MKIESFNGNHRFLSNFYPAPVTRGMFMFPTVENAYQAAKWQSIFTKDFVHLSPGGAKRRSDELCKLVTLEHWDDYKVGVMQALLLKKFHVNTYNAHLLNLTGDAELIEGNTWNDTFWGVCNGVGENRLGLMLMDIRQKNRTSF